MLLTIFTPILDYLTTIPYNLNILLLLFVQYPKLMEDRIQSMKEMTFEHNVDMILKGPHPDIFENLKRVSPRELNTSIFALLLRPRRNQASLP